MQKQELAVRITRKDCRKSMHSRKELNDNGTQAFCWAESCPLHFAIKRTFDLDRALVGTDTIKYKHDESELNFRLKYLSKAQKAVITHVDNFLAENRINKRGSSVANADALYQSLQDNQLLETNFMLEVE